MVRVRGGSASDRFHRATFNVAFVTANAVKLKMVDDSEVWIGMSNLSWKSEHAVNAIAEFPAEVELEIREWVLRKAGFDV